MLGMGGRSQKKFGECGKQSQPPAHQLAPTSVYRQTSKFRFETKELRQLDFFMANDVRLAELS